MVSDHAAHVDAHRDRRLPSSGRLWPAAALAVPLALGCTLAHGESLMEQLSTLNGIAYARTVDSMDGHALLQPDRRPAAQPAGSGPARAHRRREPVRTPVPWPATTRSARRPTRFTRPACATRSTTASRSPPASGSTRSIRRRRSFRSASSRSGPRRRHLRPLRRCRRHAARRSEMGRRTDHAAVHRRRKPHAAQRRRQPRRAGRDATRARRIQLVGRFGRVARGPACGPRRRRRDAVVRRRALEHRLCERVARARHDTAIACVHRERHAARFPRPRTTRSIAATIARSCGAARSACRAHCPATSR